MNRTLVTALVVSAMGLIACEDRTTSPRTAPSTTPRTTAPRPPDTTVTNPSTTPNQSADARITSDIRRAIAGDTSLPMTARDIQITVSSGAVTLRGVVDSQDDKDAIEAKVKTIDGVSSVDNQLEVKK